MNLQKPSSSMVLLSANTNLILLRIVLLQIFVVSFTGGFVTQKVFGTTTYRRRTTSSCCAPHRRRSLRPSCSLLLSSLGGDGGASSTTPTVLDTTALEAIRSMRVKDLKAELAELQISTNDVFEKDQLVERLYQARLNKQTPVNPKKADIENQRTTSTSSSASTSTTTTTQQGSSKSENVIRAPLYFASLQESLRIAAVNMDGGITVNAGDNPYPTIQIQVVKPNGSGDTFPLTLLLDTACSGFVLRPSVIRQYNLPQLSTPVTMTGAGGTADATGLSQLDKFQLGGQTFGPLPAAVQDIGALPATLDGIIGLSFLQQFSCVEMDFEKGEVAFHKNNNAPQFIQEEGTEDQLGEENEGKIVVLAKGEMSMLPLGIYSVDVMLGSRGPVTMLVDTGASCSFLNWRGVASLGLSKDDSSFVQRLTSQIGAMGSDNVAMQLTHRINVSSVLNMVPSAAAGSADNLLLPGLSLKDSKRLSIDIGEIAVLDTLRAQNVGGILGIDALMRCSGVRLTFKGPRKEIFLLGRSSD